MKKHSLTQMIKRTLTLFALLALVGSMGCGSGGSEVSAPDGFAGVDSEPDVVPDVGTADTEQDALPDSGGDSASDTDVETETDIAESYALVANLPDSAAIVGTTVELPFSVTNNGSPADRVWVDFVAEGGRLNDSRALSDTEGTVWAKLRLDTLVGESVVSATIDNITPAVSRITREPDALRGIGEHNPTIARESTQTLRIEAVDRYGNLIPGLAVEIALHEDVLEGSLDSGDQFGAYESDTSGAIEFSLAISGFVGERSDGETVAYGTLTALDTSVSIPLEGTLTIEEEIFVAADLPPHFVIRPGDTADVTIRAETAAGDTVSDLAVELVTADADWTASAATTDSDGVARVTLRAPDADHSETELTLMARGVATPLGLALTSAPTFDDDLGTLLLTANSLEEYDVLDGAESVLVIDSVTFSDDYVRNDLYVFSPADAEWTHVLNRRHIGEIKSHDHFLDGRFLLVETVEGRDDEGREFAALVDLERAQTHVLAADGLAFGNYGYEAQTGILHYSVEDPAASDDPFRILRTDLGAEEFLAEELYAGEMEPAPWFGECDGVFFWQALGSFDFFRVAGRRSDAFEGAGRDRVQLDIVHADSGNCSAFLHNFEGDDNSLYEIVPRADAYRLVHLLDGHDPYLIVPSNDLSFIVVDSWDDSILRTIHLGDVPVVTELTGPHTLDGIHPTELSNDEMFLVVERHYVRGIEELFYVLTDGSGPVIPTRVSPEIPFGAGAWPLRRWVTSPDFDELVLLHPAVPFARDRRLGVFIVDLENPEAGSISIDPTAGPDPYGESESFETCGYDPSGRWRFAVGDPETRDLQTFYVWRRSDGRVRATWQEIADNLIAEFLANGDWASLVSSTSVRLVNVTEAFDEE